MILLTLALRARRDPRWDESREARLRCRINKIFFCCAFASGDPLPPRPVVFIASSNGVEPLLFVRVGSAPHSSRVCTAWGQRVRTARCNDDTPRLSVAFGSAPA